MLFGLAGCATLQQIAALTNVDFAVDRLTDVRLGGLDLARVRFWSDLSMVDAGRLALAVSQPTLPLDCQLHLTAENPAGNSVDARLVRMDWTLLLQVRGTLSGVFANELPLPRGQPRTPCPYDAYPWDFDPVAGVVRVEPWGAACRMGHAEEDSYTAAVDG